MENEKESKNVWKLIEQAIVRLKEKTDNIENRLNQLQSQTNQPILSEIHVREQMGLLGGKTVSNSPSGLLRYVHVPCCDLCGQRLNEKFTVCGCGRKICDRCTITLENRTFCTECLTDYLPLTKKEYKVLILLANGVSSLKTISDFTKMEKEDIRASLAGLNTLGLIIKKGYSIFSDIYVTDDGLSALSSYQQVFGKDADLVQLDQELRRYLTERMKR